MHAVAEVHDTPFRSLRSAPLGAGRVWLVQVLPSQRAADGSQTILPSNSLSSVPTAMHAEADVHETPFMRPPVASCIVQELPSQRAANPPTKNEPTAVHAVADVHETPPRKGEGTLRPTPGVGVAWIVQVLPSQNSANVASVPLCPTAVQDVADAHETAFRSPPLGLGVVWVVQVLPSQRSANVPPLPDPTAVHAVADAHETAFRPPPLGVLWIVQVLPSQRCTPPGPRAVHAEADEHETVFRPPPPPEVGVVWIVQVLPSHCSASGPMAQPMPQATIWSPTAVQALADEHETAFRLPPLGVGVVWIVQLVPSQRSATVPPTAMHAVAEAHDTADRLLLVPPLGLGVVSIVQLVPSQNSASVAPAPLFPTAVQSVADVHETAFRLPPLGVGVVWVVQVLPSQRSTNGPPLLDPTAVHAVADEQDVAERTPVGSRWLGMLWSDQAAAVNLVVVFVWPSGPTQMNGCPGWKLPHT